MGDVIPLVARKEVQTYRTYISSLDKLDLLAELVEFQGEYTRTGYTPVLVTKGRILFRELAKCAETKEFKNLIEQHLDRLERYYA